MSIVKTDEVLRVIHNIEKEIEADLNLAKSKNMLFVCLRLQDNLFTLKRVKIKIKELEGGLK